MYYIRYDPPKLHVCEKPSIIGFLDGEPTACSGMIIECQCGKFYVYTVYYWKEISPRKANKILKKLKPKDPLADYVVRGGKQPSNPPPRPVSMKQPPLPPGGSIMMVEGPLKGVPVDDPNSISNNPKKYLYDVIVNEDGIPGVVPNEKA